MRGAPRTPEPRMDEREPRKSKRNQKDRQNAEQHGCLWKRRWWQSRHCPSPRRSEWERATSASPISSTATPATAKALRGTPRGSRATALRTIAQPATSNKKPNSFMPSATELLNSDQAVVQSGLIGRRFGRKPSTRIQIHPIEFSYGSHSTCHLKDLSLPSKRCIVLRLYFSLMCRPLARILQLVRILQRRVYIHGRENHR
jgi:hypothetical protein